MPDVKLFQSKSVMIYGIVISTIFLIVYLYTDTMLSHILIATGYILLYFGIGFLAKLFGMDDVRMVLELVNSKKLLGYINSEMKNKK